MIATDFTGAGIVNPISSLIRARGDFGPGMPHLELTHRIGDVILLGRERAVIRDRLPTGEAVARFGVHGGLSRAESFVTTLIKRRTDFTHVRTKRP
jgi:hypothetical protein